MFQSLSERIKSLAIDVGFTSVGISPAEPSPTLDRYLEWISAGMHGSMDFLARPDRIERRRNLDLLVPEAKSIVAVALSYAPPSLPMSVLQDPMRGRISNYAWGSDYHIDMIAQLKEIKDFITAETNGQAVSREYVDTGPVLERSHAEQSGLGFVGKNTMLIDPRRGSYQFIGIIITSCSLEFDPPVTLPSCGSCTRCLTACPTQAFPAPYVLDARRCISYLTIEHKGTIPFDLRSKMGNWVYGCDICQEVCPWQRFSSSSEPQLHQPFELDKAAPRLTTLLSMTEDSFHESFEGSSISRIGRDRFVRNACIAAGNSMNSELVDQLIQLTRDSSPLVRRHAIWALGKIEAPSRDLHRALDHETDYEVRDEIRLALKNPERTGNSEDGA